jgi:hypothetical protein
MPTETLADAVNGTVSQRQPAICHFLLSIFIDNYPIDFSGSAAGRVGWHVSGSNVPSVASAITKSDDDCIVCLEEEGRQIRVECGEEGEGAQARLRERLLVA